MGIFSRALKLSKVMADTTVEAVENAESNLWKTAEGVAYSLAPKIPFQFRENRFIIPQVQGMVEETIVNLAVREDQVYQEEIVEIKEYNKAQLCDYVIQEHNADKAGLHWDFRINIDGKGHSWVIKRMKLPPKSPERPLKGIQQPTHKVEYFDFEGEIVDGYGKGTVNIAEKGIMEVFSCNNNRVDFAIYDGDYPGHYTLKRWYKHRGHSNLEMKGKATEEWAIIRRADKSALYGDRPTDNIKENTKPVSTNTHIVTTKYDGTHSKVHLDKKLGTNQVLSRRKPSMSNKSYKARGRVLHQEDNLPWIRDMKIGIEVKFAQIDVSHLVKILKINPNNGVYCHGIIEVSDFDKTVLHVEVYHPDGHAVTSGILNSNPIKAQLDQKEIGRCRIILTDIEYYCGVKTSDLSYEARWFMMQNVVDHHPEFEMPHRCPERMDAEVYNNIRVKQGYEGTVQIPKTAKYGDPIGKTKGIMDIPYKKSYYIVGFVQGKGQHKGTIGAIQYSATKGGEVLGTVNPSKEYSRDDMRDHPRKYIGKQIVIKSRYEIPAKDPVRAPAVHVIKLGKEPGLKE